MYQPEKALKFSVGQRAWTSGGGGRTRISKVSGKVSLNLDVVPRKIAHAMETPSSSVSRFSNKTLDLRRPRVPACRSPWKCAPLLNTVVLRRPHGQVKITPRHQKIPVLSL